MIKVNFMLLLNFVMPNIQSKNTFKMDIKTVEKA